MSVTSQSLASKIASLNINNKSRIKYIIGIDYGTTYTGMSLLGGKQLYPKADDFRRKLCHIKPNRDQ